MFDWCRRNDEFKCIDSLFIGIIITTPYTYIRTLPQNSLYVGKNVNLMTVFLYYLGTIQNSCEMVNLNMFEPSIADSSLVSYIYRKSVVYALNTIVLADHLKFSNTV